MFIGGLILFYFSHKIWKAKKGASHKDQYRRKVSDLNGIR
jgi:hypothetical protein